MCDCLSVDHISLFETAYYRLKDHNDNLMASNFTAYQLLALETQLSSILGAKSASEFRDIYPIFNLVEKEAKMVMMVFFQRDQQALKFSPEQEQYLRDLIASLTSYSEAATFCCLIDSNLDDLPTGWLRMVIPQLTFHLPLSPEIPIKVELGTKTDPTVRLHLNLSRAILNLLPDLSAPNYANLFYSTIIPASAYEYYVELSTKAHNLLVDWWQKGTIVLHSSQADFARDWALTPLTPQLQPLVGDDLAEAQLAPLIHGPHFHYAQSEANDNFNQLAVYQPLTWPSKLDSEPSLFLLDRLAGATNLVLPIKPNLVTKHDLALELTQRNLSFSFQPYHQLDQGSPYLTVDIEGVGLNLADCLTWLKLVQSIGLVEEVGHQVSLFLIEEGQIPNFQQVEAKLKSKLDLTGVAYLVGDDWYYSLKYSLDYSSNYFQDLVDSQLTNLNQANLAA